MIWLPMADHSLIADISANKNVSVNYFHARVDTHKLLNGSEVLKCDCEVTEVID